MEQVMDTMRDAGSRVLAALCETGKAVAGFVTGVVKSVSCAVAGFVKQGSGLHLEQGQAVRQGQPSGAADRGSRRVCRADGVGGHQLFPGQKEIK